MFVRTRDLLPCRVFRLFSSVLIPLSPDRGLTLSPNRVLHIRPQISTERPLLFIVRLICIDSVVYQEIKSRIGIKLSTYDLKAPSTPQNDSSNSVIRGITTTVSFSFIDQSLFQSKIVINLNFQNIS